MLDVIEAAADFHARFSARSKTYRYQLSAGSVGDPFTRAFTWQMPELLDVDAMRSGAAMLVGTHDFTAFQSVGTETSSSVRTIFRSEICHSSANQPAAPKLRSSEGGGARHLIAYEVKGNGFLRHMVRAIVGTLVEIGRGWREPASMMQLLDNGTRAQAGATAPPHGLFLVSVDYD